MKYIYQMFIRFTGFIKQQDGAVTVDWVVLTAAVVFLGVAVAFSVSSSIPTLANQISTTVANSGVTP